MTDREEIDMLRRAVADLTERVRALEARLSWPVVAPVTGSAPLPTWPNGLPVALPATCVDPLFGRPITTCVMKPHGDVTRVQRWG